MRGVFDYLVKPLGDNRYDNVRSNGLIISTSLEDATTTQRLAEIIALPLELEDDGLSVGDIVVVHHNVFRRIYDIKGRLSDSSHFVRDGIYAVNKEFMYMRKDGDDWKAIDPFVFVSPLPNDVKLQLKVNAEKELFGIVEYSNKFEKGSLVSFEPDSEYYFNIDGKKLYRMFNRNICLRA